MSYYHSPYAPTGIDHDYYDTFADDYSDYEDYLAATSLYLPRRDPHDHTRGRRDDYLQNRSKEERL
ncbi:MAG: hypothetical protein LIO91_08815 [Bacteroidales bacterium]|nr:hypothetical protein [Bacteroidales bacterium]